MSTVLVETKKQTHKKAPTSQTTLKRKISISGIGLFSGEKTKITLCPAEADTGILFQRMDLSHKPFFPATLDYVEGTPRCTVIGTQGVFVQTVEHLLSALCAYEIDNALVEVYGSEIPILDGSAQGFVQLIEEAGVLHLGEEKIVGTLEAPFSWSKEGTHLIALPSQEYRISYTLHYPQSDLIGTQYYTTQIGPTSFKQEIAPARTFSLYEEVAPLIEKGFIKGGSLENAVLVKDNGVANPGGLRFKDEMVRHKILDLIGDLSLIGIPFLAHIIAIRSGHAANCAFAKELARTIKLENG